jgi:hypothetical protein
MEKQLMKGYKSIDKRTRSLEKDSSYEKDNVKEALHGLVDEMDTENAREIYTRCLQRFTKSLDPRENIDAKFFLFFVPNLLVVLCILASYADFNFLQIFSNMAA